MFAASVWAILRPYVTANQLNTAIKEAIMAAKQEILDAVAAERAQVGAKLDALNARITELEGKLAGGDIITAKDLAEIKAGIGGIFEEPTA
jgi:hypothetical protein